MRRPQPACANVVVRNARLLSTSSVFRIGVGDGVIRNVTVENRLRHVVRIEHDAAGLFQPLDELRQRLRFLEEGKSTVFRERDWG